MYTDYIMQGLIILFILVVSIRIICVILNTIRSMKMEMLTVAEMEILDKKPHRIPKKVEVSDETNRNNL